MFLLLRRFATRVSLSRAKMAEPDLYNILGVKRTANDSEIKKVRPSN
jgi:hypothetical protein